MNMKLKVVMFAALGLSLWGLTQSSPAMAERQGPKPAPAPNIVDVALEVNAETGEFSTLIAALVAADLVDTLSSRGQYTVFAPTDAAFAAIGLDADNIGDVPVEDLTNILLFHVAHGRRDSTDILESERVRMLNRGFTFPSLVEGAPFIDEAPILMPDVEATNGIIHVIGGVLAP